jgi:Flp pilus assembly secretin CpaC
VELLVENGSLGKGLTSVSSLPSFNTRKGDKLRLRDGESNLLAGLLQEDERRRCACFPTLRLRSSSSCCRTTTPSARPTSS